MKDKTSGERINHLPACSRSFSGLGPADVEVACARSRPNCSRKASFTVELRLCQTLRGCSTFSDMAFDSWHVALARTCRMISISASEGVGGCFTSSGGSGSFRTTRAALQAPSF